MQIFAHLVSGSSWTGAMMIICDASSLSLLKSFVWTIESMTEDEPVRGTAVGCKLTLAQRHSVAGNIGIIGLLRTANVQVRCSVTTEGIWVGF